MDYITATHIRLGTRLTQVVTDNAGQPEVFGIVLLLDLSQSAKLNTALRMRCRNNILISGVICT